MALLSSVILVLVALTSSVTSQGIMFPGMTQHPDGECSVAPTGGRGWCRLLKDCPPMMRQAVGGVQPTLCGVRSSQPVVCCPLTTVSGFLVEERQPPLPLTTVPPPPSLPECGRNGLLVPAHFKRLRRGVTAPPRRGAAPLIDYHTILELDALGWEPEPVVAGGRDAVRNRWPWMALLGHRVDSEVRDDLVNWYCDGTLLNSRWVLTAAHCLDIGAPHVIRLGDHDKNSERDFADHVDFAVNRTEIYPDFRQHGALSSYHDLALIELDRDMVFREGVSPICLPWGEAALQNLHNENVTITGWGATAFGGEDSNVLQEAEVTVFPSQTCDDAYQVLPIYSQKWPQGIKEDTFLCAGKEEGGVDTCQGDSGGPLANEDPTTNRFVLRGVVSQGYGCGLESFPGLYVPVGHPRYLAWIKEVAFSHF